MLYFLNNDESDSPVNDSTKEPKTLSEVLRRCVSLLRDNLPDNWSVTPLGAVGTKPTQEADSVLALSSPEGVEATLVFEAKRVLERRDVPAMAAQLRAYSGTFPNARGIVAARYLSPSVREALAERGLSYIDATGNERLIISAPGLFVSNRGADRDPWGGPGRPRGTLKGAPAARVVRALVDFSGPWRIRDLIECSGASTGATYRVVDYLEREELLLRDDEGKLVLQNWRRLLQEWSKDYGFVRSNRVTSYIEPRGMTALMQKAGNSSGPRYAVTGSLAAAEWAPYAPARTAQIYVADAAEAARVWGLRPTEAGANILLAEPESDVVFERVVTNAAGIAMVTPAQGAVDLLTGPGRNPSEAEELLDWMERNEPSWRL